MSFLLSYDGILTKEFSNNPSLFLPLSLSLYLYIYIIASWASLILESILLRQLCQISKQVENI